MFKNPKFFISFFQNIFKKPTKFYFQFIFTYGISYQKEKNTPSKNIDKFNKKWLTILLSVICLNF